MKIAKIILLLVIIGAITYGAYLFFKNDRNKPVITEAPNTFVAELDQKIKNMRKMPANNFCVIYYNSIKNDIAAYFNAGSIDANYKENLHKNLDYEYTPLFIKQAYYVFQRSEWEKNRLDTIRTELRKLLASTFIDNDRDLIVVNGILTKFDEIVAFASGAGNFANNTQITSVDQKFELEKTQDYINKARSYYNLKHYANNCEWLQTKLASVPSLMYNKHLKYLQNKVDFCTGMYRSVVEHQKYYDDIFVPVYKEFALLQDNYSPYAVNYETMDQDLTVIKNQFKKEGDSATYYYSSKKQ